MFPQRLTRSASLKLICELTGRGMQFGLAYTAQRLLGQVGYGQFSFSFSVGYVLAVFTDFGLQLIITREVAHGATHIARMGLLIKLALTGLALLALIAIATTRPIDQRGTFLLLGIALILNTFTEYFGYVLRGLQHITEEALLLLTQRALVAVSGVVLLWWRLDVMSLAVAYIVGAIATTSYAALRVRALLPTSNIDRSTWRTIIRLAAVAIIAVRDGDCAVCRLHPHRPTAAGLATRGCGVGSLQRGSKAGRTDVATPSIYHGSGISVSELGADA